MTTASKLSSKDLASLYESIDDSMRASLPEFGCEVLANGDYYENLWTRPLNTAGEIIEDAEWVEVVAAEAPFLTAVNKALDTNFYVSEFAGR
jgi:hypothetical protein